MIPTLYTEGTISITQSPSTGQYSASQYTPVLPKQTEQTANPTPAPIPTETADTDTVMKTTAELPNAGIHEDLLKKAIENPIIVEGLAKILEKSARLIAFNGELTTFASGVIVRDQSEGESQGPGRSIVTVSHTGIWKTLTVQGPKEGTIYTDYKNLVNEIWHKPGSKVTLKLSPDTNEYLGRPDIVCIGNADICAQQGLPEGNFIDMLTDQDNIIVIAGYPGVSEPRKAVLISISTKSFRILASKDFPGAPKVLIAQTDGSQMVELGGVSGGSASFLDIKTGEVKEFGTFSGYAVENNEGGSDRPDAFIITLLPENGFPRPVPDNQNAETQNETEANTGQSNIVLATSIRADSAIITRTLPITGANGQSFKLTIPTDDTITQTVTSPSGCNYPAIFWDVLAGEKGKCKVYQPQTKTSLSYPEEGFDENKRIPIIDKVNQINLLLPQALPRNDVGGLHINVSAEQSEWVTIRVDEHDNPCLSLSIELFNDENQLTVAQRKFLIAELLLKKDATNLGEYTEAYRYLKAKAVSGYDPILQDSTSESSSAEAINADYYTNIAYLDYLLKAIESQELLTSDSILLNPSNTLGLNQDSQGIYNLDIEILEQLVMSGENLPKGVATYGPKIAFLYQVLMQQYETDQSNPYLPMVFDKLATQSTQINFINSGAQAYRLNSGLNTFVVASNVPGEINAGAGEGLVVYVDENGTLILQQRIKMALESDPQMFLVFDGGLSTVLEENKGNLVLNFTAGKK